MDQRIAAPHPVQQAHADAGQRGEEARPPCKPRPEAQTGAFGPRPQPPRELLLAQLSQKVGQRDLDRTHDPALIAQGRRLRQIERVFEADVRRRQDRADRPGIDPAV